MESTKICESCNRKLSIDKYKANKHMSKDGNMIVIYDSKCIECIQFKTINKKENINE